MSFNAVRFTRHSRCSRRCWAYQKWRRSLRVKLLRWLSQLFCHRRTSGHPTYLLSRLQDYFIISVCNKSPFPSTGTLRCLQKEMETYRHWSVSLWRDPDDVSHCQILSPDKTEWRLISATLCGWKRCFVADQLWLMKCIQEDHHHHHVGGGKWRQLGL